MTDIEKVRDIVRREIADILHRVREGAFPDLGIAVDAILNYRAALPHLGAQREEIDELAVLDAMRTCWGDQKVRNALTVTVWKDGIDIQRPSHSLMQFASAILSLPTVQGQAWKPIETAPKDGTNVLVCWAALKCWPVTAFFERGLYRNARFEAFTSAPTHWMPLPPSPPAEGE